MRVILGAVQQSQHLHLHTYCLAARTTPILLVNEVRRIIRQILAITVAESMIGRTRRFG
jgi:hypothetical protein